MTPLPLYLRRLNALYAEFLETGKGKQWIANLYSHVFTIEHARLGPYLVPKGSERS